MVGPWQFLRFSLGCCSSYRVKIFSLILDWLKIYLFYCFVFCYPLYTHLEPHLGRLLTWCLGIPPRNVSPSSQCLHSTCGHMESLRTEHILDKLPSRSAQFLNCVHPFVTPWTVAPQTPLSMEFSRQDYWNGLPFPPPGDLPDPGIKLLSPTLASRFFTAEPSGKPSISFLLKIFIHFFWS